DVQTVDESYDAAAFHLLRLESKDGVWAVRLDDMPIITGMPISGGVNQLEFRAIETSAVFASFGFTRVS
ncbi:MAG: hypothetical protein JW750_11030, partial [Anaerolineaceae bacterium]|nr:hypothetical protein [Anaerolineaceae bacterium]